MVSNVEHTSTVLLLDAICVLGLLHDVTVHNMDLSGCVHISSICR